MEARFQFWIDAPGASEIGLGKLDEAEGNEYRLNAIRLVSISRTSATTHYLDTNIGQRIIGLFVVGTLRDFTRNISCMERNAKQMGPSETVFHNSVWTDILYEHF